MTQITNQNTQPPPVAQAAQASNPTVVPTGTEGPLVKDTRTIIQQMAEIRDILAKKFPKVSTTVRLDVTTSEPGIEFAAYNQNIPETDPKSRYGSLKAQTVQELKGKVEAL
jgi:hypothetical protein